MYKHIISLILVVILCFLCTSCGLNDRMALDKDLYVTYKSDGSDVYLQYKSVSYRRSNLFKRSILDSIEEQNDVEVGWGGMRLGYIQTYYSEVLDSPTFLYNPLAEYIFVREDYDYHSCFFRIVGKDIEFIFSETIAEVGFNAELREAVFNPQTIVIQAKDNERLRGTLTLFAIDGVWYAYSFNDYIFTISDDLVELLRENHLVL